MNESISRTVLGLVDPDVFVVKKLLVVVNVAQHVVKVVQDDSAGDEQLMRVQHLVSRM